MTLSYSLTPATKEESEKVLNALIEFDFERMPHLPRIEIKNLDYVLKDEKGTFMGGICAEFFWGILTVKFLSVDKPFRGQKLGKVLLDHIEKLGKENGCYMVYLDTFDFQAKDFYMKEGYEIFGILNDCPPGNKRFFLTKKLS